MACTDASSFTFNALLDSSPILRGQVKYLVAPYRKALQAAQEPIVAEIAECRKRESECIDVLAGIYGQRRMANHGPLQQEFSRQIAAAKAAADQARRLQITRRWLHDADRNLFSH